MQIIPLQPCSHIVYSFTSLSQPCHNLVVYSQSHCNLAATLSIPSQGCHKLSQLCHNLVETSQLQPHCLFLHKVATTSSQPCNNFTSSLQPYDHNVMFVTSLSQPCHIFTTPPQACDTVTYVHLMIFILTKTQRKFIEIHST